MDCRRVGVGITPVVLSLDNYRDDGTIRSYRLDTTDHTRMIWKIKFHVDASFSRDGNRLYVNWPISDTEVGMFCYDISKHTLGDAEIAITSAHVGSAKYGSWRTKSFDNDDQSAWQSEGTLDGGWIEYNLGTARRIRQIRVKWLEGNRKAHPLKISVGDRTVFAGNTERTSDWWTKDIGANGDSIRIELTGKTSDGDHLFGIREVDILE